MSKEGHWWCPSCKESPSPTYVTFEENHERCGHPVTWIEFKDMPPASEGVREALENLIFTAEKLWNDTPKPIMSGGAINVTHPIIEEAKQTLAALPELEKRECNYNGHKLGINCLCNGHGEVWVRKAGV